MSNAGHLAARFALHVALGLALGLAARPARAATGCGTLARLPGHAAVPREHIALPRLADKLTRDPFMYPGQKSSANFTMRWQSAVVTGAEATLVLDQLEEAWTLYNDDFHQSPPFGSDTYRINVYIDTVADDPGIAGIEAYAAVDDEGYPYLVLNHELFAEQPVWVRATVAHELYHDYQYSLGGYQADSSYWWWEATADWACQQLFPDEILPYAFDGAYVLSEELALFDAGDAIANPDHVIGLRQYGASLFPLYFTDTRAARSLVVNTWEHGLPEGDALDDFMAELATTPDDAADAFSEFATHLVAWDVPRAAVIEPNVETFEAEHPDHTRIDATVGAEGTDWATVPTARALHPYGFDLIELTRPTEGPLMIDLETTPSTPPATFRATLVRLTATGPTYTPIDLASGTGRLEVTLPDGEPTASLVVAAIADTRDTELTFAFRYRIGHAADPPMPDDSGGCGCAVGGHDDRPAPWPVLVLLGLALARRRYRSAASLRSSSSRSPG